MGTTALDFRRVVVSDSTLTVWLTNAWLRWAAGKSCGTQLSCDLRHIVWVISNLSVIGRWFLVALRAGLY